MEAYGFINRKEIEQQSSSGGAFTAILEAFVKLCRGGNWVCFGAAFDESFNVVHMSADNLNGCTKFRGSKYVASDISHVYPELAEALLENKYVLFSGTPCQVSAVRKYIEKNDLSSDRFYTIDVICHGTPDHKLWKDYVSWLEKENHALLKSFSFRHKGISWKRCSCMAEFSNGIIKKNTFDVELFISLYYTGLANKECCYRCQFANTNRTGDITLGDFWGFRDVMTQIASEWEITANDNVSLILVNTEKGRNLINAVTTDASVNQYHLAKCKTDGYITYQQNLRAPVQRDTRVDAFREDYKNYGFEYITKKYCGYSAKNKVRFFIRKVRSRIRFELSKVRGAMV